MCTELKRVINEFCFFQKPPMFPRTSVALWFRNRRRNRPPNGVEVVRVIDRFAGATRALRSLPRAAVVLTAYEGPDFRLLRVVRYHRSPRVR